LVALLKHVATAQLGAVVMLSLLAVLAAISVCTDVQRGYRHCCLIAVVLSLLSTRYLQVCATTTARQDEEAIAGEDFFRWEAHADDAHHTAAHHYYYYGTSSSSHHNAHNSAATVASGSSSGQHTHVKERRQSGTSSTGDMQTVVGGTFTEGSR
jgi:hypothetical protein